MIPHLGYAIIDSASAWAHAETEFFRALNAFVEPWLMAGWGASPLFPTGLIVLETIGERSGQPRRVPVMATVFAGCVFIGTLRGSRSQWVRNLQARPRVRYWLGGRARHGEALVVAPGMRRHDLAGLPPLVRRITEALLAPATLLGWTFAIIVDEGIANSP